MGGNGVEIVATAKGESGRLRLAATTVANGFSSAYSVPLCFKDFGFPITAITGPPHPSGGPPIDPPVVTPTDGCVSRPK